MLCNIHHTFILNGLSVCCNSPQVSFVTLAPPAEVCDINSVRQQLTWPSLSCTEGAKEAHICNAVYSSTIDRGSGHTIRIPRCQKVKYATARQPQCNPCRSRCASVWIYGQNWFNFTKPRTAKQPHALLGEQFKDQQWDPLSPTPYCRWIVYYYMVLHYIWACAHMSFWS